MNILLALSLSVKRRGAYFTRTRYVDSWFENNVAEDGTSNFVWVEVAYIIPEEVGEVNVNSTITFHLSSV